MVKYSDDVKERFWSKVNKAGRNECWEWSASLGTSGYGQVRIDKRTRSAHRVAYELAYGSIPDQMCVDHICHNRACVNAQHLRLVTGPQNQQNRSGACRTNKSGLRGVTWSGSAGKWQARAMVEGRAHHLGYFDAIEDANRAAENWRKNYMPFSLEAIQENINYTRNIEVKAH